MKRISRLLEAQLSPLLNQGKVLTITGARQVGKTTMLREMFEGVDDMAWLNADDPAVRQRLGNISLASLKTLIGNYKLVVIDEVQRIENAGLLLKLMIDNFKDVQFIATGSSALDISETIFEPLTGRQFLFHLYPFAMQEIYPKKSPFEWEQELPFHLVYGCYPDVYNNRGNAGIILKNLTDQYLYKDVLVWKDIRKPKLLDSLLKMLAYQVCSEVSMNELGNALQVKAETVESYIDLLEKAFVVFRLNAYSTNHRKEISKMSKVYFWDNGVRNTIVDELSSLSSRNDQGQLWENFVVSERMKMIAYGDENVKSYFWRNYNKSEVDYLEMRSKKLHAYEIKWNSKKNHKVTRAFTNDYPDAGTGVVTPLDFAGFLKGRG